jgi:osmoprotectant transport system permease protein
VVDAPERKDRVMGVLGEALRFLTDPERYGGPTGIDARVVEHVLISYQAVAVAAVIALPVGLFIGHRRRFEVVAVTVGNLGRAVPSFGVLGILFGPTLGWPGHIGYWATFIALVLLSVPPILINTYVGIKGVDASVVEAARGMGMTSRHVLQRVEVPLAAPIVVSGLRIAAVQSIATATLWGIPGGGGVGRIIVDGFALRAEDLLLAGAMLIALLAIATEVLFSVAERVTSPRAARRAGPRRRLLDRSARRSRR